MVEIWSGSGGWHTEILAAYLRLERKLYTAHFNSTSSFDFYRAARRQFIEKLSAQPDLYNKAVVTSFNPPDDDNIAPSGTVDRVEC